MSRVTILGGNSCRHVLSGCKFDRRHDENHGRSCSRARSHAAAGALPSAPATVRVLTANTRAGLAVDLERNLFDRCWCASKATFTNAPLRFEQKASTMTAPISTKGISTSRRSCCRWSSASSPRCAAVSRARRTGARDLPRQRAGHGRRRAGVRRNAATVGPRIRRRRGLVAERTLLDRRQPHRHRDQLPVRPRRLREHDPRRHPRPAQRTHDGGGAVAVLRALKLARPWPRSLAGGAAPVRDFHFNF